jgi:cytochrome c oxidase cbb3-type subunit 1
LDSSLNYNYKIVRQFAIATVFWGVVGMLVGVFIAAQLAWPALNFDVPWLTYGRLRPLHTNAVMPMGLTRAKEYAELEWPIAILIAIAGARGRALQRRMAPHPPRQPARCGARIEHARLSVAG